MQKKLLNKNIVLTRAGQQSDEDVAELIELGADVISFPTIKVVSCSDYSEFDKIASSISATDYLIFTSSNSVLYFHKRISEINKSIDYGSITVVAVGKKTSEACKSAGIPIHLIPEIHTGDGIVVALSSAGIRNKNVLIPCSALANDKLKTGLENLGSNVYKIPVYDVVIPSDKETESSKQKLNRSNVDLFIFTSPSTFNNFIQIMNIKNPEEYFSKYIVAAIGTVTKSAIEEKGVRVDIIPPEFNMKSLIKEIVNFYSQTESGE